MRSVFRCFVTTVVNAVVCFVLCVRASVEMRECHPSVVLQESACAPTQAIEEPVVSLSGWLWKMHVNNTMLCKQWGRRFVTLNRKRGMVSPGKGLLYISVFMVSS